MLPTDPQSEAYDGPGNRSRWLPPADRFGRGYRRRVGPAAAGSSATSVTDWLAFIGPWKAAIPPGSTTPQARS